VAGEVRLEALTLRLNDDVVEVVGAQSTELIPIDKLGGRVQRGPNGKVRVQIGWLVTEPVVPQYGWSFAPFSKARVFDLASEEELQVRAFFQQIATRCGREVEQEPPPKQKRGWLRRGGSDSSP
jgi:hypothetical protein